MGASLGDTWTHLRPCVLLRGLRFARTLAPGNEHGRQSENHGNHDKPHQKSLGVSSTHPGSTTETARSRRTTFYSISLRRTYENQSFRRNCPLSVRRDLHGTCIRFIKPMVFEAWRSGGGGNSVGPPSFLHYATNDF